MAATVTGGEVHRRPQTATVLLVFGLTACGGGGGTAPTPAAAIPTAAPTAIVILPGAPTATATPRAVASPMPTPAPTSTPLAPVPSPSASPSQTPTLTQIALTQCPTVATEFLFVNGVPQVVTSGPFDFALVCPNGASPPLHITYPPNRAFGIEADVPNSGAPPREVFSGLDAPGQLGMQTLLVDQGETFGTTATQCTTTVAGISPPFYCDHVGFVRYWDKTGMIDFVFSPQAVVDPVVFPK